MAHILYKALHWNLVDGFLVDNKASDSCTYNIIYWQVKLFKPMITTFKGETPGC